MQENVIGVPSTYGPIMPSISGYLPRESWISRLLTGSTKELQFYEIKCVLID